jgi:glycosyltransferase involved in cell wall biosynthesis
MISVIISTFGVDEWKEKAEEAAESVYTQSVSPLEILMVHKETLAEARNYGADQASGEWLCFLDADDALDDLYIETMLEKASSVDGNALIQPSTKFLQDGRVTKDTHLIEPSVIEDRNWMVIGTLVRREQLSLLVVFKNCYLYMKIGICGFDVFNRERSCFKNQEPHISLMSL